MKPSSRPTYTVFGSRLAYTLVEISVVLVIISVIATFAIPTFLVVLERARAREGVTALMAIYEGQQQFKDEEVITSCASGACYAKGPLVAVAPFYQYVNFQPDPAAPSTFTLKYFSFPVSLGCGSEPDNCASGAADTTDCSTTQGYLGRLTRSGGLWNYNLFVLEDGRVVCRLTSGSGASVCQGICEKMGFPTDW